MFHKLIGISLLSVVGCVSGAILQSLVEKSAAVVAAELTKAVEGSLYFDDVIRRAHEYPDWLPAELKEPFKKEFLYHNYGPMLRILDKGYLYDLGREIITGAINRQNTLLAVISFGQELPITIYRINGYSVVPHMELHVPGVFANKIFFNESGTVLSIESDDRFIAWRVEGTAINSEPIINMPYPDTGRIVVNAAGTHVIVATPEEVRVYAIARMNEPDYQPQRIPLGIVDAVVDRIFVRSDDSFFITVTIIGDMPRGVVHQWSVVNGVVQQPRELFPMDYVYDTKMFETDIPLFALGDVHQTAIWEIRNGKLESQQVIRSSLSYIYSMYFDKRLSLFVARDYKGKVVGWRVHNNIVNAQPLFQEKVKNRIVVYGDRFYVGMDANDRAFLHIQPTLDLTLDQMLFLLTLERLWRLPLADIKRAYKEHKEDRFAYVRHALHSLLASETFSTFPEPIQNMLKRIFDEIAQKYQAGPLLAREVLLSRTQLKPRPQWGVYEQALKRMKKKLSPEKG